MGVHTYDAVMCIGMEKILRELKRGPNPGAVFDLSPAKMHPTPQRAGYRSVFPKS